MSPSESCVFTSNVEAEIGQIHRKLSVLFDRVFDFSPHEALFLIENTLFIPKRLYKIRTAPFFRPKDKLAKLDDTVKAYLEKILNVQLSGVAWRQASLPVSSGGLGFHKIAELALPAYLASYEGSRQQVKSLLEKSLFKIDEVFLRAVEV